MNDTGDLPKIPLDRLSTQELRLILANARQGGRTATAEVVARELARRGAPVPGAPPAGGSSSGARGESRSAAPRASGWPVGLAASVAGLVALSAAGGWLLFRDESSSPEAPALTTMSQQTETATTAPQGPMTTGPRALASAQPAREPQTSRFASRATIRSGGGEPEARPGSPAQRPEPSQGRSGGVDNGRLAMARSDPELAGPEGGAEILAASGAEIERASDCAAAASPSETMLCNDALRVARNERRGRISSAPARIVVARNMPALPSLAGRR